MEGSIISKVEGLFGKIHARLVQGGKVNGWSFAEIVDEMAFEVIRSCKSTVDVLCDAKKGGSFQSLLFATLEDTLGGFNIGDTRHIGDGEGEYLIDGLAEFIKFFVFHASDDDGTAYEYIQKENIEGDIKGMKNKFSRGDAATGSLRALVMGFESFMDDGGK